MPVEPFDIRHVSPEDGDQGEQAEDEAPGERGEITEKGQQEGSETDDAQPTGVAEGDAGVEEGEEVPALGRPGEISPEEAKRLLDGVEEGTPRVPTSRQRQGDKDW